MPEPEHDPNSPSRMSVYNSVAIPDVPPEEERDYWPTYEELSNTELRRHVDRGDDVVIVGGGWGITTVVAARMTHYEGTVTTFEANSEMKETVERSMKINNIEDVAEVRHHHVGPAFDSAQEHYGPADGEQLNPEDLPVCDVLELDCEGAEREILEKMEIRPHCIIVESHPPDGVTTEEVIERLHNIDYEVVNRGPNGPEGRYEVLTAVRES